MIINSKKFKYDIVLPAAAKLPVPMGYEFISDYGKKYYSENIPNQIQAYKNGIKHALPNVEETVISDWTEKHYSTLAMEELDAYKLDQVTLDNYQETAQFKIPEQLLNNNGKGNILVCGHYGRNVCLNAVGFTGISTNLLTVGILKNPHLDEVDKAFLLKKAQQWAKNMNGEWISTEDNYRKIYQLLNAGQSIMIAMDVPSPSKKSNKEYPFLGGHLNISTGAVRLAKHTKSNLYYIRFREDGYQMNVEFIPLDSDPETAMKQAVLNLEKDVIDYPWLWWLWGQLPRIWRK